MEGKGPMRCRSSEFPIILAEHYVAVNRIGFDQIQFYTKWRGWTIGEQILVQSHLLRIFRRFRESIENGRDTVHSASWALACSREWHQ